MPPKWIPWKDRLEPTDLAPTDSIGTDPDDERIEEGEVEESSLQDVNDAVETFRLTRRHVLTSLGRAQAAKRWYEGPRGPKALSTKTAEGNLCSTDVYKRQGQGGNRRVLADDALVQFGFHVEQFLGLGLSQLEHRDTGGGADDLGDHVLVHDHLDVGLAFAPGRCV